MVKRRSRNLELPCFRRARGDVIDENSDYIGSHDVLVTESKADHDGKHLISGVGQDDLAEFLPGALHRGQPTIYSLKKI